MPEIQANGITLYYEQHGEGAPVLCIHGTSSSALVWKDAVTELAGRGRLIVYDRRGCFRSERPQPYVTTAVGDHADDAAALLEVLSAAPAVVIGRSYGGEIALDLARRYPARVTALALLEPAMLSLDPDAILWSRRLTEKVLDAGARDSSSVAEVFLREVAGDEAWESFPTELKQMFIGNGPAILAELRGGPLDLTVRELAGIAHPTLIVSAKESPEAFRRVDETLAEALPNCETVLVEGGHLISPANPAVLEFVDRIVTATPTPELRRARARAASRSHRDPGGDAHL
ncbi:MAG: alpha/beta fold hydrolase [Actinomycetota bacterium]